MVIHPRPPDSDSTRGRTTSSGEIAFTNHDGEKDAVRDLVFGVFTDSQRMVCGPRWKYIEYPIADRQQLFDVQNDPSELENRISDDSLRDVVSELKNQLNLWRRKNRDPMLRETHNR